MHFQSNFIDINRSNCLHLPQINPPRYLRKPIPSHVSDCAGTS
jgi:hypothetical protein